MITYVIGDATQPQGDDMRIIAHICNDVGAWGKGFVVALSARWWGEPERHYRTWKRTNIPVPFALGNTTFAYIKRELYVANMIAQHGLRSQKNPMPIDYQALAHCLDTVGDFALRYDASVHMPRIGTGLAGGDWERISALIEAHLCARGVRIAVYDLPADEP